MRDFAGDAISARHHPQRLLHQAADGKAHPRGAAEGGLKVPKPLLTTDLAKVDELGDRKPRGATLRALNKATGELLGEIDVDAILHGPPMTYLYEGRQHIAVAAGGGRSQKGELVVGALPR